MIADEDIVRKLPWVEDFERSWKTFQKQEEEGKKEISDMFPQKSLDGEGQGGDE